MNSIYRPDKSHGVSLVPIKRRKWKTLRRREPDTRKTVRPTLSFPTTYASTQALGPKTRPSGVVSHAIHVHVTQSSITFPRFHTSVVPVTPRIPVNGRTVSRIASLLLKDCWTRSVSEVPLWIIVVVVRVLSNGSCPITGTLVVHSVSFPFTTTFWFFHSGVLKPLRRKRQGFVLGNLRQTFQKR